MSEAIIIEPKLHLVAWEITRRCNLSCAHCRASAGDCEYPDELTTAECTSVIDDIVKVGRPILILTGGEPLIRQDVFDIARYGVSAGMRVVMGTNGTLITAEVARRLAEVPISRLAISLDFPTAQLQDLFRGQAGAYDSAMAGIRNALQAGIEIQINSTITKMNVDYLGDLLDLSLEAGAVSFHPFLLVPTGRGKNLSREELAPEQYEKTLHWIYDKQKELGDKIFFKPTDVPHYMRVMRQRQAAEGCSGFGTGRKDMDKITRGCLAGTGFCFVSHRGIVQGCGYLDVAAGDIRREPFNRIWADSPVFNNLRNLANIKGKCGICEFRRICGGCRARAYEATGDYLAEEPYCIYQPGAAAPIPGGN